MRGSARGREVLMPTTMIGAELRGKSQKGTGRLIGPARGVLEVRRVRVGDVDRREIGARHRIDRRDVEVPVAGAAWTRRAEGEEVSIEAPRGEAVAVARARSVEVRQHEHGAR